MTHLSHEGILLIDHISGIIKDFIDDNPEQKDLLIDILKVGLDEMKKGINTHQ